MERQVDEGEDAVGVERLTCREGDLGQEKEGRGGRGGVECLE